jgi:hypothetical protein
MRSLANAPEGTAYNGPVRFVLPAVMAAMLAVVTTTDRIACFDGCTDEAQHEGRSTTTISVCGLCHGWSGPLALDVGAPVALPVVSPAAVASRELPAHLTPPDHPPKPA